MLDDELDHIIREAAENHHPPYNDTAWDKMEMQLDKHLPQKKDRKRPLLLLLFFILLGGSIFFMLTNRGGNDRDIAPEENKERKRMTGHDALATNTPAKAVPARESQAPAAAPADVHIHDILPGATETGDKTTSPGRFAKRDKPISSGYAAENEGPAILNDVVSTTRRQNGSNKAKTLHKQNTGGLASGPVLDDDAGNGNRQLGSNSKPKAGNRSATKARVGTVKPFEDEKDKENLAVKGRPVLVEEAPRFKVNITSPGTANDDNMATGDPIASSKDQDKQDSASAEQEAGKEPVKDSEKPVSAPGKKRSRNSFGNNFGLTLSAGPDMSFVSLSKAGKVTFTYGAGLSYDFAKRFTVRAGFYVSKKVYNADPDQYHNVIYPNLTSIDADCKVFEIPLSVSYRFGQRKNHNWFGGVGLSSFIMKKEDYTYNYKTQSGQVYTYARGISNENKHYFSVLNLSGGYQYHINNRFSLLAEPYLKVPLSGVGLGKIKLNSTGILFTAIYKPFAKRR